MRSNTTRFIIPLTKVSRHLILTKGFVNSYLRWKEVPEETDCVFLLYTHNSDIQIPRHEIRRKIISSRGVVIVMNLSTGLSKEISKIINGQYSKLNREIKDLITDFWSASKHSFLYGILHKDKKASGMLKTLTKLNKEECWHKFNITRETLN